MYLPQAVCGDFWELSVLQHEEPTQILFARRKIERNEMKNPNIDSHINQGLKNTPTEIEYLLNWVLCVRIDCDGI